MSGEGIKQKERAKPLESEEATAAGNVNDNMIMPDPYWAWSQ